ncbi:MAG: serine/threonine protein kinase [Phycisphaeraceae bacterium]|nr:serine/threonine protein kinase [Phycisphaeraceae bacterium]MBX3367430.1 serine/threonine protein kinase [Phycisphaeraceae bacterium]
MHSDDERTNPGGAGPDERGGGGAPEPSMIGSRHMGETPSGISQPRRPAPETIGPYRVRGVLGEGGFGVVYLADQEKPVRRQVAIKLLRAGRENDQVIARFQRERQSLVRMEHPGIARVFETAELPDGRPYIVMELVRGLPITTFCDEGKLSLRARLELVGQVCRAVQHAHTKGMIHRDLKPSNVLVTVSDGKAVVKIIDFGIAKPVEHHEGEQTVYTQLHQIVGTPGYMSPEQVRGLLDIDTRTDVYSIGVMLYELLAGAMPLDPALFKYKTAAETERIISESEPARPSMRVSRSGVFRDRLAMVRGTDGMGLARELKGELDWVVMKCLEKEPARRYQSPAELEQDIQRYLSGEAVEAVPPTLGYRARKYVRRHRALVVSAAAIVLALVGGLASAGYGLYRANVANTELTRTNTKLSEAIEEVTRQEKKATREAARSGAFSKLFVEDVLGSANVRKSEGKDLTVAEVLDGLVQQLDQIEDGSVRAAVEQQIGEIYRALGRSGAAYDHFTSAISLMRDDPETPRTRLAEVLVNLTIVCRFRPEDSFGLSYASEAYQILTQELGADHHRTLYAAQLLSGVLAQNKRSLESVALIEDAERRTQEAMALKQETLEHLVVMTTYATLVLVPQGRRQERYDLMTRVIESADRLDIPELDKARYLGWYGEAASQVGRYDEAFAAIERAIEIETRIRGSDTVDIAVLFTALSTSYRSIGRFVEAEDAARRALEIYEDRTGPNSETSAATLSILAAAVRQQGRHAEALGLLERVIAIYEALLGSESWRTLNVHSMHAEILVDLKRFEEAEIELLEAERGLRESKVAVRPLELTHGRLIKLYEATGNTVERDRWIAERDRRRSASESPKD